MNDGQIVANFTDSLTLAAAISGFGTLSKAGSGTLTLSGISTYSGATTVNGGTLSVTGSIASSSGVTVNAGTLNGTGTVSDVTINAGGTLAPGLPAATGTLRQSGTHECRHLLGAGDARGSEPRRRQWHRILGRNA